MDLPLSGLGLEGYVQMICTMQGNELSIGKFEKEFIVESQIGEALMRLMKEKRWNFSQNKP